MTTFNVLWEYIPKQLSSFSTTGLGRQRRLHQATFPRLLGNEHLGKRRDSRGTSRDPWNAPTKNELDWGKGDLPRKNTVFLLVSTHIARWMIRREHEDIERGGS